MTIEQAKEIINRFEDHKKGLDVEQPDHETYAQAYALIAVTDHETYAQAYALIAVTIHDKLSREVNERIIKHNGTTL